MSDSWTEYKDNVWYQLKMLDLPETYGTLEVKSRQRPLDFVDLVNIMNIAKVQIDTAYTNNDLSSIWNNYTLNSLQALASIELAVVPVEIKSEPKKLTKDDILFVITKWKMDWMNVKGTDEVDRKNYFDRAFGVDSNMKHDLARRIFNFLNKEPK